MAEKRFEITLDTSRFVQQLDAANRAFDAFADKVNKARTQIPPTRGGTRENGLPEQVKEASKEGDKLNQIFTRTGSILAGVFASQQISAFVQQVASVRGQFQQLEISFTTMLGSAHEADKLMSQLTQTAAKTPFDLQGVASSAKSLLAYGFAADQVNETIVRLGDVASGLSQPLGDIVYLYGTLRASGRVTNVDIKQFANRGIPIYEELARVLGVTQDKINGMVSAGKVGFPHIEQAFKNLTSEGGKFANLMQEQSKSITGQISNLGDAFDMMLNDIGKSGQGLISESISVVASLVENYDKVGRVLVGLIATYGVYKAALITNIALTKTETLTRLLAIKATKAHAVAQALLNKTMLSNPYVLVAVGLTALVATMWALHDRTTAEEKAQRSFNEAQEEAKRKADEHRKSVEELISVATNDALATFERESALAKLRNFYPQIFAQYDVEKLKLADILKIKQQIAVEDGKRKEEEFNKSREEANKNAKSAREKADYYKGLATNGLDITGVYANQYAKYDDEARQAEEIARKYNQQAIKEADTIALSRDSLAKKSEAQLKAQIDAIERLKLKMKKENKDTGSLKNGLVGGDYTIKELEGIQFQIKAHLEERNKTYKDYATRKKEALNEARKAEEAYNAFIKKSSQELKEWRTKNGGKDPAVHEAELKRAWEDAKKLSDEFGAKPTNRKTNLLQKKKELERLRQEQEDYDKVIGKTQRETDLEIRAQSIELKEEGFAKEQALLDLQHDRALEAVKARGEEMIRQYQEQKRREWEATHDANNEVYIRPTLTTNDLPSQQREQLNTLEDIANKQHERGSNDLLKKLLEQYKGYEEQRADIHKKYDEERKAIEGVSTLTQEQKQIYIIELERKRAEVVKSLDDEVFEHTKKNNALMIDLFSRRGERTVSEMKRTIKATEQALDYIRNTKPSDIQGQTFSGYAFSADMLRTLGTSPEKIKAVTEALRTMKDEVADTSPIQRFSLDMQEAIDGIKAGLETGNTKSVGLGIEKAGNAVQGITPQIRSFGHVMGEVFGQEMAEQIGDLADGIESLGGIASGVGKIMMGDIIGGAFSIISSIGSLVTKSQRIAEENRKKELKAIEEVTKAQNAYNQALIRRNFLYEEGNTIFGSNTFGKMINDLKVADKAMTELFKTMRGDARSRGEVSKNLISELLVPFAGLATTALKGQEKRWVASSQRKLQFSGLGAIQIKDGTHKGSGFLGTGLWARTHDTYKSLLDVYPELIGKTGEFNLELAKVIASTRDFKDGNKGALEDMIKNAEQHKEAMESVRQSLSNTFGGLGQQIGDELVEAFKRGEDAGKAFATSVGKVFENFVKQIAYNAAFAKPLQEASEKVFHLQKDRADGILSDEALVTKTGDVMALLLSQLKANKELYKKMLKEGQSIANERGFEALQSVSDSRSSSVKGITQASQDSIDTMVGQGNTKIIQGDKMIALQERMAMAIEGMQLHRLSDINQRCYQELTAIRELTERVEGNTASIKAIGQDIQRNGLKLSR